MTEIPLPGVGHEQYDRTAVQNPETHRLRAGDTPLTDFHERTLGVGDKLFSGKSVLDVGCGGGWLLERALKHGATQVVGIEPSDLMGAAEARLEATSAYLEKTTFEKFEVAGKFDLITFVMSTEHMPNLPSILQKAERHMADGGKIVIITADMTSFTMPRFDYTVSSRETIPGKEEQVTIGRPSGYGDTTDLVRTVDYWRECAAEAGLAVCEQRPVFADSELVAAEGWQQLELFAQSEENDIPLFQYFCMVKAPSMQSQLY